MFGKNYDEDIREIHEELRDRRENRYELSAKLERLLDRVKALECPKPVPCPEPPAPKCKPEPKGKVTFIDKSKDGCLVVMDKVGDLWMWTPSRYLPGSSYLSIPCSYTQPHWTRLTGEVK